MPIDKILIVEPDRTLVQLLVQTFKTHRISTVLAENVEDAQARLDNEAFDLILVSDQLATGSEGDLLRPGADCLLRAPIFSLARTEASAADALKHGATDFILAPVTPSQIELALRKAAVQKRRLDLLSPDSSPLPCWTDPQSAGASPAAERLRQSVRKLAFTNATVLIQGECGSGRSYTAKAAHALSPRAQGPLIRVDCAALEPGRLPAILFGEEQCAASGHRSRSSGRIEAAHGGTLLIEEISLLPSPAQKPLLHFLQSQTFQRIGGKEDVAADVRIITTTSRPLEEEVKAGRLREDLFHTLAILPVHVPPLRERIQDIPGLANTFRLFHARKTGREILAFSAAAIQALQAHSWPGNLRELESIVAQAVLRAADGRILEPSDLFSVPAPISAPESGTGDTAAAAAAAADDLATVEKHHIFAVLEHCKDNRTHAARRLGISIRTLRNKLREYRQEDEQRSEQKEASL